MNIDDRPTEISDAAVDSELTNLTAPTTVLPPVSKESEAMRDEHHSFLSVLDEHLAPATLSLPVFHTDGLPTAIHAVFREQATPRIEELPVKSLVSARAKRSSAPFALRAAVIALFVVLLFALLGVVMIHVRPGFFRRLRHDLSPQLALIATKHQSQRSQHFRWIGQGSDYVIPATSYSIGVDITRPCWVIVKQLRTGTTLFEATMQPGGNPQSIPVNGGVSVEVAARAIAIVVREGSRTLGVISNPVIGTTYDLIGR